MASKRFQTLLLAFLLLLAAVWSAAGTALAVPRYTDTSGHWAEAGIEWAVAHGITQGYQDGSFRPNKIVTEAELLTMLFRAAPVAESVYGTGSAEYALQPPAQSHWADSAYRKAALLNYPAPGITDPALRDRPVTRLKAAEIMAGAYGYSYEGDQAVIFVMANGIAGGKDESFSVDSYHGSDPVTRGEAVELIRRSKVQAVCRPVEPALAVLKPRPPAADAANGGSTIPYCLQPAPSRTASHEPDASSGSKAAAVEVKQLEPHSSQPAEHHNGGGTGSGNKGASAPPKVYYLVRQGDTLYRISQMFGLSVQAISEANGLLDPGSISIGLRLLIPGLKLPENLEEVTVLQVLQSTLTAYTAGYESTGKTPSHPAYGVTRSGTMVEEGRTVAVDPAVIPFGTRVYIDGIGFRTAEDTGRAITGSRLDVFIESLEEARSFGVKPGVLVFVLA
jgi:3D (Asp-Asp-Asp) domain-containing protein